MANKKISTILSLKDKMSQPLTKVSKNVDKVTKEMKKSQNQIEKWKNNSVKAIDKVVSKTAKAGVAFAVAGLGLAAKTSIDLEDAFSGVRKTVDATEEEFAVLRNQLNHLAKKEIPIVVDEMYEIAEMAGQLGIAKENIVDFSDVMAKLGVATNMSSEQASTSLARLANITGMPQTNFDRLGSTIVALGNNLATTENEIVEMGLRLAGTGSQVGLTEAQILALSGAMSSVGINAEAGGSSMSRVLQKINTEVLSNGKNLKAFAKISGMTGKEFKESFKSNPTEAITEFVKGLDGIKNAGGDVTSTLKKLGINSTVEIDTLSRLAGASDVLTTSLELGSKAWEENNALNEEAAEKFKNTKSQLQFLKNNLRLAADSIGQILLPHLNSAIEKLIPFIDKLSESKDAIKNVVDKIIEFGKGIVDFVIKHEQLITTILIFIGTIYAVIKVVGILKTVLTGLNTVGMLLNGTLMISPFGWVVLAIGAVVAAGVLLWRNWETVIEWAGKLKENLIQSWEDLKDGAKQKWEDIVSTIKEKWEGLKTFLKNPIKGTVQLFKKTKEDTEKTNSVSSSLPAFAKGTSYSPSGWARINEDGGEIRKLSSGETIIPADKSDRLLKNKTGQDVKIEVTIQGNVIGNKQFVNEVGNEVYTKVKLALDNI